MFCRNCKGQINPNATFCTVCGAPVGAGKNYCPACGENVSPLAVICVKCGTALVPMNPQGNINAKSKLAGGLLGIFLGGYGVHNFYLGYIKKAVIQLVISFIAGAGFGFTYFLLIFSQIANIANNSTSTYNYNSNPFFSIFHCASMSSLIIMIVCFAILMGIRLWTLIEAIFILIGKINKDAKGNLLKD